MNREIRARRLPDVDPPPPIEDPSILEGYLEDASGSGPGRSGGLFRVRDETEAAAFLRRNAGLPVLPQAARSSLTGGAVPRGEVVLSVEGFDGVGPIERHAGRARVQVQPGVRLCDLQVALSEHHLYYPPVPTYQEAMVGGTVSTNAGGAATFKYGVTRQWVHGLRVLLFNGDLLELERGQVQARPGESFRVVLSDGRALQVPVPEYRLPELKKISAGYHVADPTDLVDLFVGAEGTLGMITGVSLELVPLPAAQLTGLAFLPDVAAALRLSTALRTAAERSREHRQPLDPDVRAIEFVDDRSLDLLRDCGDAARLRVPVAGDAGSAVLFEVELDRATSAEEIERALGEYLEDDRSAARTPVGRLVALLDAHGALDELQLAFPDERARAEALREFREAVPRRVNELLAEHSRATPGLHKVGGDLIVPYDQLSEMLEIYRAEFSSRGLPYAVWGHLSDGNLHPNAIPRTRDEVLRAEQALLRFADEAIRRGGSPLSEHGVGRSPLKQRLLQRFLGEPAIEAMRRVKQALDPPWRFAPGVLFSRSPLGVEPGLD